MKQSLSIKIPDDLIQKLQEISKAESKPIGELVKELIQNIYLLINVINSKVLIFPMKISTIYLCNK